MILKPGDRISVVTSSGSDIDVMVSYCDKGTIGTAVPGAKNTKITTATTTTVLDGPSSGATSVARVIETISMCNIDATTANTVTVSVVDGVSGATCRVYQDSLDANDQLHYDRGQGWTYVNAV